MAEFLGKLSIAEAMGELFGEKVRIITAISSFIGVSGIIAIQLKISLKKELLSSESCLSRFFVLVGDFVPIS
jgi:hypothetical protein